MNREIAGKTLGAGAHDVLIADQNDGRPIGACHLRRRLDGDLRADAIGIAKGEGDGLLAHSGNAISVSTRELSQTTTRSFSHALPSSIL